MRSPINAVPINGASVNVWIEAPALISEAGVFGVGERHPYVDGSITVSAVTPDVVPRRFAYLYPKTQVNLSEFTFTPLRTAYVYPKAEAEGEASIGVTRYAYSYGKDDVTGTAEASIDESSSVVFAVVLADPIKARAITWIDERAIEERPIRIVKASDVQTSFGTTRAMANTAIGRGVITGEATTETSRIHLERDVEGSCNVEANTSADKPYLVHMASAVAAGHSEADLSFRIKNTEETLRHVWVHPTLTPEAELPLTATRFAEMEQSKTKGGAGLELDIYRVRGFRGDIVAKSLASGEEYNIYHAHWLKGSIVGSSFALFGPHKYRLRWFEASNTGEADQVGQSVHLKWVGANAVAEVQGQSEGLVPRRTTRTTAEPVTRRAGSTGFNKIYHFLTEKLRVNTTTEATGVRMPNMRGVAEAQVIAESAGVRWTGHGMENSIGLGSSSNSSQIRTSLMFGSGDSYASIRGRTKKIRLGFAEANSDAEAGGLNKVFRWSAGDTEGETKSEGDGLRNVYLSGRLESGTEDVEPQAVRWAGHGQEQTAESYVDSDAVGIRIGLMSGDAELLASQEVVGIRQAKMNSSVLAETEAVNLKLPVRIGLVYGSYEAVAEEWARESRLRINHWQFLEESLNTTGFTEADSLRIHTVEPFPPTLANASESNLIYMINADSKAPFERQIFLPGNLRELLVPHQDREVLVR